MPAIADVAAVYVTPDINAADPRAALPPEVVSLSARLTALGPLPRPSARDAPAPWDALLAAGQRHHPVVGREHAARCRS